MLHPSNLHLCVSRNLLCVASFSLYSYDNNPFDIFVFCFGSSNNKMLRLQFQLSWGVLVHASRPFMYIYIIFYYLAPPVPLIFYQIVLGVLCVYGISRPTTSYQYKNIRSCLYFYMLLLYPTYTLMQYKKGGLTTGFCLFCFLILVLFLVLLGLLGDYSQEFRTSSRSALYAPVTCSLNCLSSSFSLSLASNAFFIFSLSSLSSSFSFSNSPPLRFSCLSS